MPGSRIHFLQPFVKADGCSQLIAVDLGRNRLLDVTGDRFAQPLELLSFGVDHPRHFAQLGRSRHMAVLTESDYPSATGEPTPRLYLLAWDGRTFRTTTVLPLGFAHLRQHTTGDEIAWDGATQALYVTLRTYDRPFEPWVSNSQPGTPSTGGLFLKVRWSRGRLTVRAMIPVDPNPRYFCMHRGVAYICCQGNDSHRGSVMRVDIRRMRVLDDVADVQGQPNFYLAD